ncbi:MAG: hypothetical protein GXO90_06445 [FCB group bacterium]|nr:hypothetical protein [FCB group bacterium]
MARITLYITAIILFISGVGFAQFAYNHPELDWQTFETEHFIIHFYDATRHSAQEGAEVAELIYPKVTELYQYEPKSKTHLIFMDTDDIANGAAYYYDNKIVIWASPLDYELRGSHRWLQNVVTHEFTHIVTMQKSMKAGQNFPALYLQWIGYEPEKRKDVLFGYPNEIISYAVPGTVVPPWLAEGLAQYQFDGSDYDNWDTHRDMILRDRVMHDNLLSFPAMNSFGKRGIGNESVYNSGYALTRFIAVKYGSDKLRKLVQELSRPTRFSINQAIKRTVGIDGDSLYSQFAHTLEKRYEILTETVRTHEVGGRIILGEGTTNLYPIWDKGGKRFIYISNRGNDYFSQTNLYIHDMATKKEKLVAKGVQSAAAWSPDGQTIYYSRRPDHPNGSGSSYNDLFAYDIQKDKSTRLTKDSRGRSPVFIPGDSAIAYISTRDGMENVFMLSLADRSISQLTDFQDHRLVHQLHFDSDQNRLVFDATTNHFRNIYAYDFSDSTIRPLLNTREWDERDLTVSPDGNWLYADDRTGIFNLYQLNPETGKQTFVTNVLGGAFMPNVNSSGQCLYVEYADGGYKIALMDSLVPVDDELVGYSPVYYRRNGQLKRPILEQDVQREIYAYEDQFPPMFLLPRLMMDYNTFKPGFYFYSDEILHRLNIFGGAGMNRNKDVDLFFRFEFHRFFPTLYAETTYLTRNTFERNLYSVYSIDNNLRFRMVQFQGGMLIPIFGIDYLELYGNWQRYRAFIKETIPGEALQGGLAYDYYRGSSLGIHWKTDIHQPRFDGNINPSKQFVADLRLTYELNDFIDGLDLNNAGTLQEIFKSNDLWRFEGNIKWSKDIPHTPRWTLTTETEFGYISNQEADSFFNFFGGGLPGIQGYPFYSMEGKNLFVERLAFRVPVFRERHIKTGWLIWQNSVAGILFQFGDAWDTDFSMKKSIGFQWRINGFSFYNFPVAIGWEIHRGLTSFQKQYQEQTIQYGHENRNYFTILFGF